MISNKSQPTLFYSWQSDHPKTRTYIEKALQRALQNVAQDMSIEDAPRLDKDTQGEVGAVSITATIKRKISEAKIFVADVSLIDIGRRGKKLANQNVMFELGYAFGKKTEQAVMLIANKDLGGAKELPFDIAQNRIMFCSPTDDPKGEKIIPILEYAIRAHLDFVNEASKVSARMDMKEQLLDAIEGGKPTQTKAEIFFESLYKRYADVAPEISKGGELYTVYGERTTDGYQKTLPLIKELYEVVSTAAEYGDMRTTEICYKMLGSIAARYDQYSSDEFAALTIQEIASVLIGCLAKYERWDEIKQLINTDFAKPKGGVHKYKIEDTYHYPQGVNQFYNKKIGTNFAIPTTPLIQNRFADDDKILQAYVNGSFILMLALDFYYPYISGILLSRDADAYMPEWIPKLKSKSFASNFAKALGITVLNELQERLENKRKQPLSDGLAYWNRDITHILDETGLMPIAEKVGTK